MINTGRLRLVPIDYKYSKDLYEIWSDFEVIKYTYVTQVQNLDECNKRIEMLLGYTNPEFINNFLVVLNDTAIGVAGLPIMNKENIEFGFYYHYGRKYWGNGYATEVAKALIDYIYNRYPSANIYADAVSINDASMQVLKKIGFRQTYIEEAGFQKNGYQLDLVHFICEKSIL